MSELNNLPTITVTADVSAAYNSIITFVSNKVPGSNTTSVSLEGFSAFNSTAYNNLSKYFSSNGYSDEAPTYDITHNTFRINTRNNL